MKESKIIQFGKFSEEEILLNSILKVLQNNANIKEATSETLIFSDF